MSEIPVPASFGELLDKISILQIRSERVGYAPELEKVRRELATLESVWMSSAAASADIAALRRRLREVNERRWDIEDAMRRKQEAQAFDAEFVRLERAWQADNDERSAIKREINRVLGSTHAIDEPHRD